MDRALIVNQTPTSQVRLLCEELLSDGKPHSRREMERYIEQQTATLGLPLPTHGCMAGGIRNALQRKNCVKLGTALYQALDVTPSAEVLPSRTQRAAQSIQATVTALTSLAHEIDYIEADETELHELNKLKDCITALKKIQNELRE